MTVVAFFFSGGGTPVMNRDLPLGNGEMLPELEPCEIHWGRLRRGIPPRLPRPQAAALCARHRASRSLSAVGLGAAARENTASKASDVLRLRCRTCFGGCWDSLQGITGMAGGKILRASGSAVDTGGAEENATGACRAGGDTKACGGVAFPLLGDLLCGPQVEK